jgi:hypothetical protein
MAEDECVFILLEAILRLRGVTARRCPKHGGRSARSNNSRLCTVAWPGELDDPRGLNCRGVEWKLTLFGVSQVCARFPTRGGQESDLPNQLYTAGL